MPLTEPPSEVFAAALARLESPRRLAIAVSGGCDSVTLAHLCAARAADGAADIIILHVDHRLRAASDEDAHFVAGLARGLGAPARILTREGRPFPSAVQARARAARYRLLADAAAQWGADALLVAHSADDQAETAMMRRARSDSLRSRAGMAEESFIAAGGPPVRLLRPLLSLRRAALRAIAVENGWRWREDPSNENLAFERVRARKALAEDRALALKLIAEAVIARRAVEAAEAASIAAFDAAGGTIDEFGAMRLPADYADADLMARLVRAAGAGATDPAEPRAARALSEARRTGRATLGGARASVRRGILAVEREPAALLGRAGAPAFSPRLLAAEATAIFDRRFIVRNGSSPVLLRPTGGAGPDAAAPKPDAGLRAIECLVAERFFQRVRRFDVD